MLQCPEMVAPYGSYEPLYGTNPFSIGIPTTPRPQVRCLLVCTPPAAFDRPLRSILLVSFTCDRAEG
jgi:LDH2 family malate/lactate/ureidoglycolate dehydrogenase